MPNLQVKDINASLYADLKTAAKRENRSVTQEVIFILEKYLSSPQNFNTNPTKDFLALTGSYQDSRSAAQIVSALRKDRKNSQRFEESHGILD